MTGFLVEPFSTLHILISIFILIYFDYILFTKKNNSNHTPTPTTTNTTTTTTYRYYHLLFSTHCLLRSVRNHYTIQNHQCCRCRNVYASSPNCRRPHSNNRKSSIAETASVLRTSAIYCPFSKRKPNPSQ